MPDAVQFTLSDGTVVLVAPPARAAGTGAVGLGSRLETAERTLRQALRPITSAAAEVIGEFRALAHRPEEVEITFGVTLDASLGAIIAGTKTGAHLDVSLRWSGGPAADPGTVRQDCAPPAATRTVTGGPGTRDGDPGDGATSTGDPGAADPASS
ncbi:CU044_2847 family protein [Streptomyces sp. NPDC004065]|uniref:CU044_2847 family protein n=1 Tax=Streptomyces sp. NPDC004065 TaxID=3364689 RepID=UPI00384B26C1